jgi:lipopolysaccharide transport system ATP-binding protein
MSAIEVFGRPVPRRAIIGFVGADPDAISRELRAAIDSGNRADLIVDYALDLMGPLARMRSRRDLIAARHTGATILLASYREDLLRELCDEIWWIGVDAIEMRGDPGEVLDRWKKATVELWRQEQNGAAPRMVPGLTAGDGRAHIRAVDLLDASGAAVGGWMSGESAAVRVAVEFAQPVADPVIGILIRTRIGLNVYGTNTELERLQLGPRAAGDRLRLLFRFRCDLCPGEYTLTVASHDPDGLWHEWLDDVVAFTVADVRYTAGVANLRAAVEWTVGDT